MSDVLIKKIPLQDYERVLPIKQFPRMPLLYLELLENKNKVRNGLKNIDYVPPDISKPTVISKPSVIQAQRERSSASLREISETPVISTPNLSETPVISTPNLSEKRNVVIKRNISASELDRQNQAHEIDTQYGSSEEEVEYGTLDGATGSTRHASKHYVPPDVRDTTLTTGEHTSHRSDRSDKTSSDEIPQQAYLNDRATGGGGGGGGSHVQAGEGEYAQLIPGETTQDTTKHDSISEKDTKHPEVNGVEKQLESMLNEVKSQTLESENTQKIKSISRSRSRSRSVRSRTKKSQNELTGTNGVKDTAKHPPSLADLKNKQSINKEHYLDETEETQKERNAVYFKYEVLRRMHPNTQIPEFTLFSDPKLMTQKYDMLTKKLALESSVDNWKRYMIVFVMCCEVALGKLQFDMEGFAQHQISSMSTYDQLLVEMAQKSYTPSGPKWPAEMRLGMMITMNIVLFVISRIILKKTGANLLGTISSFTATADKTMKDPPTDSSASRDS